MLEPSNRQRIIDETISAIADGRKNRSELNAQLAEELKIGPRTVAAQSAQVLIFARRALGDEFRDNVPLEEIVALHRYLSLCPDETERNAAIAQWAPIIGLSTEHVREVLERFSKQLEATKQSEQATGSTIEKPANLNVEVDTIDYDFPNKALWRDRWEAFIAKHVPHADRSKAYVLTFPGVKRPELEMERWKRLGFDPAKIIGVEGGNKEERGAFLRKASECGFTPILGRLEDVLPSLQHTFRVALLDFTGPYSQAPITIMHWLKPAKETVLIYNLADRRENAKTVFDAELEANKTNPEILEAAQAVLHLKHNNDYSVLRDKAVQYDLLREASEHRGKFINFPEQRDELHLDLCFQIGLHLYGTAFAWDGIRTRLREEIPALNSMAIRERAEFLWPLAHKADWFMTNEFAKFICATGLVSNFYDAHAVSGLLLTSVLYTPHVPRALELYEYQSQVSARSARYLSTFALMEESKVWDNGFKAISKFVRNSYHGAFVSYLSTNGTNLECVGSLWDRVKIKAKLTHGSGDRLSELDRDFHWSEVQEFNTFVDGRCVATLAFSDFVKEFARWQELAPKHTYGIAGNRSKMTRITLEAAT